MRLGAARVPRSRAGGAVGRWRAVPRAGPPAHATGRHNDRTSVGRAPAVLPTCRQGARSGTERGLGRCGIRGRGARWSVVPQEGTAGWRRPGGQGGVWVGRGVPRAASGSDGGVPRDGTTIERASGVRRPFAQRVVRGHVQRRSGVWGARVARSSVVPPDGTAGARGHGPRRSFVRSAAGWHRQATGPGRGRPGGLATAGWAPQARRRRGSAG
jgi:hypothetical protein